MNRFNNIHLYHKFFLQSLKLSLKNSADKNSRKNKNSAGNIITRIGIIADETLKLWNNAISTKFVNTQPLTLSICVHVVSSTTIPSIFFGSSQNHKSSFFQIDSFVSKCILIIRKTLFNNDISIWNDIKDLATFDKSWYFLEEVNSTYLFSFWIIYPVFVDLL